MRIIHLLLLISILISLSINTIAYAEIKTQTNEIINTEKTNGEYVRKRFLKLMNKPFNLKGENANQQKILLIGDSHAQDFLNTIAENNYINKAQIRTRYIPTRCQIYLSKNPQAKWLAEDKKLCKQSDSLESTIAQINKADVIILVAFWRKWAAEALAETIKKLQLNSNQTLFVIGRRSFRKVEKSQIQNLNNDELKTLRNEVDNHQLEINKIMKSTLNKKVFVNVHQLICGQSSSCPVFTNDLKMISFDGGHLSQAGAKFIGRELFQKSQLKSLIGD